MVSCQSSELGWEVTVELPADFLSLGRGSVIYNLGIIGDHFESHHRYLLDKIKTLGFLIITFSLCMLETLV